MATPAEIFGAPIFLHEEDASQANVLCHDWHQSCLGPPSLRQHICAMAQYAFITIVNVKYIASIFSSK